MSPTNDAEAARGWGALFWATTVGSALPLFATRWLPFADLPEHVAASATLAALSEGDPAATAVYELDLGHSQYLLFHVASAIAARAFGDAELGTRVVLALAAVAWALGLRSLLRASGGDERIALFAPMVFWNRALLMGFVPFVASVPLVLFALAWIVRQLDAPTRSRAIAIALLGLGVFYTHVSAWILLAFIATVWVAGFALREAPFHFRVPDAARIGRRVLGILAPLLPSALAALVWARAGSLARGRAIPGAEDVGLMNVARTMRALPVWSFDMWRTHLDEMFAVGWWLAFVWILVFDLRRRGDEPSERSRAWLSLVPLACGMLVFLTTPFRVGNASMLNVRLAPVVTLFALVPLAHRRRRVPGAPLALAALASIGASSLAAHELRAASREAVGNFDRLLAQIPEGARLVMLDYDVTSPQAHFWPYIFAGSYHRARSGAGVSSWSFNELAHWPVHYRSGQAPPEHHPFWIFDPAAFDAKDAEFYGYALVLGDQVPTVNGEANLVELASEGHFHLFAKPP